MLLLSQLSVINQLPIQHVLSFETANTYRPTQAICQTPTTVTTSSSTMYKHSTIINSKHFTTISSSLSLSQFRDQQVFCVHGCAVATVL